jgi:hypothetical protein
MSVRWPDLELLRDGRGDLIALSPLSRPAARRAMTDALRKLKPAFAHLSDNGPDVAIIEALAACVEVMGFYHDRFLTESKLGSAQLLDDLARIVALVGYRPLPSVAATAYQWFEALTAGIVTSGTRVAGTVKAPPSTVIYETAATIDVAPELNRMALSPLITRSPGAVRAILAPQAGTVPTDDFRPASDALIVDAQGLELAAIAGSRSRGVAFGRGLSRSFEPAAQVSRATVIRRLRGAVALAADLVAFEVSTQPILHLPSVAAPEILTSTLEIFVLRPGDDALDPSEWPAALRYTEVFDFSASEAADLHYRTFLDDALHVWIILRSQLGARTLLDDAALQRVYARFVPAVGSVLDPPAGPPATAAEGSSPVPGLSGVTLGLDPSYFATSVVPPPVPNTRLVANATWAMVDRDLGLVAGDSILILDAAGGRSARTLIPRPPGASPRLLRWAPDPAPGTAPAPSLREAHDAVVGVLDPATAKIGALTDAANGDVFPTWSELYAQLQPSAVPAPPNDLPIVASNPAAVIEPHRVVAAGATYVVLRDASHISAGDYVLLGRRLTSALRAPQPFGDWRWRAGELPFDPRTPWLDAEVVQILEVRGNVVRLASAVSQDYFVHQGRLGTAEPTPLTEVVALPGVVSVASGDQLRQTLTLATQPVFKGDDDKLYDASYVIAKLDHGYVLDDLRRQLALDATPPRPVPLANGKRLAPGPSVPPVAAQALWDTLFVAVAGVAEAQTHPVWSFDVTLHAGNYRAPGIRIAWLEDDHGERLTEGGPFTVVSKLELTLRDASAAAAVAGATDHKVVAVLEQPQVWRWVEGAPAAGEFRVRELVSFDVVPEVVDDDSAKLLTDDTGTLILVAAPPQGNAVRSPAAPEPRLFPFTWDLDTGAPHVQGTAPDLTAPFDAILVSGTQVASLAPSGSPQVLATADWQVASGRFVELAFALLDRGILVGSSAEHQIVVRCPFAKTETGLELALEDVPITSIGDPLTGCSDVWAVLPDDVVVPASAARAEWTYALAADDPGALPQGAIRLALVGARTQIVAAHADARSAVVDPASSAHGGDLGFALDALYGLEADPLPGARIAVSEIWTWEAISPPLAELPEPTASRLVAVVPAQRGDGIDTVVWRREDLWWDAERRTLRLPMAPLADRSGTRPSDLVRLLQVLDPAIDHRHFTIEYDAAADRSLLTMSIAPGWPSTEQAPAPVVIATLAPDDDHGYGRGADHGYGRGRRGDHGYGDAGDRRHGHHGHGHRPEIEIRDTAAPVDVFTTAEGSVRWTLQFDGDVRERWREIHVALRDWSAPGERGLAAVPLWRVAGSAAWRTRAAAGPVTLIVARDQLDLLVVSAMPRLADGGLIELAPIGRDSAFPAAASVGALDLAIYERTAAAAGPGATLALVGSTTLDLDAVSGSEPPAITHIVFVNDPAWQPIRVSRTTARAGGGHSYELGLAYLALFPDGVAGELRVRLCYATSRVAAAAATAPSTAHTLRLRIAGLGAGFARGQGANAAVFHTRADLTDYLPLDAAAPPRIDGDALVVELALGGTGLGSVFDATATPKYDAVALAQHWPVARSKSVVPQPLRIELGGDPPAIAEGDAVQLSFLSRDALTTTVLARGDGGLVDLTPTEVFRREELSQLTLYGLRTLIDPADYRATLALMPSSSQPPWLLSFDAAPGPPSLRTTLLPYGKLDIADSGLHTFRFAHDQALAEIFRRAGDPQTTLYLFTNERAELRADFYTGSDKQIANDLARGLPLPLPPSPNFLTAADGTEIDRLILTSAAWAGQNLTTQAGQNLATQRPVLLGSTAWKPSYTSPQLPTAQFPELQVKPPVPGRVTTGTVLHAMRFNTGNFIPIATQGAPAPDPARIIADALRISAQPVGRDGAPIPGATWRTVSYISLTELNELTPNLPSHALAVFEGMTFDEAMLAGALHGIDARYAYWASFSSVGACTLHFLFIDEELGGGARVRIEAQYEANPGRTGNGLGDPIYPLETAVVAFDPATRLALLAPGALKPGALVFVRQRATDDVPALQWTRVESVAGPIVEVNPPLLYAPTAIEPIEVTTLGKLQNAAQLDADYYAALAKAKLVPPTGSTAPPTSWRLPLHDRLPLDVVTRPQNTDPATTPSLLASLIPGDLVLVFDERRRQTWGNHRQIDSDGGWQQWPDFQHQAVVKALDADTGMLVLAAPLPDSFQIQWTLDPTTKRLTPDAGDVAALRVLPHHRAPIQGPRTLEVLGSGDSTHRFARFLSSRDAGIGSAVIPLATDGVTIGNLEVLTFDPEKAAWSRWLRYDALSRAGKKDPAFTLGFRPVGATGKVQVSVTFGDGVTGRLPPTGTRNVYLRATQIRSPASQVARPVRIVSSQRGSAAQVPGAVEVSTAVAAPNNLILRLESTAPVELSGSRDLGAAQWQPSLEITATLGDKLVAFTEITEDQAASGAHGFLIVSSASTPPGAVDVYLYSRTEVPRTAPITAVQRSGSSQWSLDDKFYTEASRRELTAAAGATQVQLLATAGLRAGSQLAVFRDDTSPPDIVHIASIDPPTWSAVVDPPLPRAYDLERSFIRGNLAPIIQGAVDRSTIGSSDGATPSLRLPLQNRLPLLYIDPPGEEPAPDVTVLVADQPWTRVLDFTGKTASDRVWRLDIDPDGAAFVVFGDGKRGAIPPAGRDHIDARVRLGSGAAGNLAVGAINKLVSGNLAIKSTTNLTPAAGGSAGDSPAEAREKAFMRRLPSDRVVSAGDCVRAALGDGGVIAAALDPTAPTGSLRLVIAMDDRRTPTPEDLEAVHDRVAGEMPAAARVRFEVAAADQSAVHLVIELGVDDSHAAADVFAAVAAAFTADRGGFFAADHWDIGEPLRLGAIYDAILAVDGVAHARVLWMADTALPEGEAPGGPAPDVFDPGATGVVRCDHDPIGDPFGRFGTFRLEPAPEATR